MSQGPSCTPAAASKDQRSTRSDSTERDHANDVRTDGRWPDGGGAVAALFEQAQREHPDALTVDRGNGLPLSLRNALQPLLTDYLVLPQKAWPWTPWHGTGRVHLRWAARRAASWAALRRAPGRHPDLVGNPRTGRGRERCP